MSMKSARGFSFDITNERFSTSNKRKFGRKLYQEDMESAWIAGFLSFANEINNKNNSEKYNDADEVIGDIQTMAVETFNNFNIKLGGGKLKPVEVEDFLVEQKDNKFNPGKWIGEFYGVS